MADKICIFFFIALLVVSQVYARNTICYEVVEENPENSIEKRQVDCSSVLQAASTEQPSDRNKIRRPPVLTEEEKKKRQARAFEGLLHLATVINHVDSFLMDKGKLILKSLGKMVASEEDTRFDM